MDGKLQEILLDYGLEGYGLYWYCLELIVNKIDVDNLTFELEHDSRIIARNTGCSVQKVTEMMTKFIDLGLFQNIEGRITCLKLLNRLDKSMTSNVKFRNMMTKAKDSHDSVMIVPDLVMQEEKREDKNRLEEKRLKQEANVLNNRIIDDVFEFWLTTFNKMGSAKLTAGRKKNILARIKEGYTLEDMKLAITGCSKSEYHMGQNDNGKIYDSLELILRNGEKLENFITHNTTVIQKVKPNAANNRAGLNQTGIHREFTAKDYDLDASF